MDLTKKKCVPCEGGIPSLTEIQIKAFMGLIDESWSVSDNRRIHKKFMFVNFKHTMDFVNKLAELAEEEGHHPVMHVQYGSCEIELWTHAIEGLSENDFILAAKIDKLN